METGVTSGGEVGGKADGVQADPGHQRARARGGFGREVQPGEIEPLAARAEQGLVLVGGNAGDFAASRLVAGTIGIAGQVGAHYAYGMRRGTLLLAHPPRHLPATFTEGGRGFDVFWGLLVRSLANEIAPFSQWRTASLPTRYAGDLAVDGRGEILVVS